LRYLLDTDTYTHLYREHPKVVAAAKEAAGRGATIGITIITKVEILRGRIEALLKADRRERFLAMQRQFLRSEEALQRLLVQPLADAALDYFERLSATRGLRSIGRDDLLIASIVLSHNATLVTRNLRHFRLIPNLKYVNWVD
jgi:tRNA(fMet)-specific endonuclease VapC